jgi:hypothetical protein
MECEDEILYFNVGRRSLWVVEKPTVARSNFMSYSNANYRLVELNMESLTKLYSRQNRAAQPPLNPSIKLILSSGQPCHAQGVATNATPFVVSFTHHLHSKCEKKGI